MAQQIGIAEKREGAEGKKPYEMLFSEFAEVARATGATNRWPQIGNGKEVLSYSVYMNGDVTKHLPEAVKEAQFQGETVHALTEKIGLDVRSFRDNLRVAEIMATRQAWMSSVMEAAVESNKIPDAVIKDYEQLTQGMNHPWVADAVRKQKEYTSQVEPILRETERILGVPVVDRAPGEVSRGKIIAQNSHFTTQGLINGEVVTHENSKLEELPVLGKDVTVTYYRGDGQVIDNSKTYRISLPYIEDKTQDLAVDIEAPDGKKQVMLFRAVSTFGEFVKAHDLDPKMNEVAQEVRQARPKQKIQIDMPERKAVTGMYIDPETKGIAFDYMAKGQRNTMIFGSAQAVMEHAGTFGITAAGIAQARALETNQQQHVQNALKGIEAAEVRTIGPNSLMDQARMMAQKNFPNNYDAQAQFLRQVGSELDAKREKSSSKDLER